MLGSVQDAEDLVQETYVRGWRGYEAFEGRAALRTWLYRIATTACLRALQNRARRVLPAGLGAASVDPEVDVDASRAGYPWLEPIPDTFTPELAVTAKHSIRLAVVTALQELPARQRARAHLAEVAPNDEDVTEPEDVDLLALVERYCAAFENADMGALTALLQSDVKLEMPPFAVWFTGRDAVTRFL